MRRALLAALAAGLLSLVPAARADVPILRSCATDSASTDRPDAVSGLQIHVIYVVPSDATDNFPVRESQIVTDLAAIDAWWSAQDPARRPRLDLASLPGCDTALGQLDVSDVRLPHDGSYYTGRGERFARIARDLAAAPLGFADPDKKYLVYYEGALDRPLEVCGSATRGQPAEGGIRGYAVVYLASPECGDLGTGSYAAIVAAHELIHSLDALDLGGSEQPPNACPDDTAHPCDSDVDILHSGGHCCLADRVLDFGRDDYYGHSGPWFDVQDSLFLIHVGEDATPPSEPPSLTAFEDADGGIRLSWPAAAEDSGPVRYRVFKNGELLDTVDAPGATDTPTGGDAVVYGVRAVNAAGLTGPRREVRFAPGLGIVDGAGRLVSDTAAPPPLLWLSWQMAKRGLVLRWPAVTDVGGLRGYRVDRAGKPYATVTATTLSVPPSKARGSWSVRAVDTAGNLGGSVTIVVS